MTKDNNNNVVPSTSSESPTSIGNPAQRIPQYSAGLSCQLGALAAGLVLGWTTCCGPNGQTLSQQYDLQISVEEFSWIGSAATIGAAVVCLPIGVISDVIGRKKSMLAIVVPVTIGWGLIIWATSVPMLYVGRFLTGFVAGVFSIAAPLYTSEISEKSIRGRLGNFYELLLTTGILLSYVLAMTVRDIYWISLASATVPLIFCCIFTFMPESPVYYLKKGKEEAAMYVLVKLRGMDYDVRRELAEQKRYLEMMRIRRQSRVLTRSTVKGLVIIYGLMFFQQMSGVNAVIFYSASIFNDAQVDPTIGTIVLGVVAVTAVFLSTLCIDHLGRKPLLMFSSGAMCLALLALGIHFHLFEQQGLRIDWIPAVCLCLFLFTSEIGLSPIPFVMIGEIIDPRIQGTVGSTACFLNWSLAFLVTKFFSNLETGLGTDGTMWFFSAICGIGLFFVFFVVIETKNKSLYQIHLEMEVLWI